jgi:hypothetical protein
MRKFNLIKPGWNRTHLKEETIRVFDICDGCRRCFNLCPSFTTLIDRLLYAERMLGVASVAFGRFAACHDDGFHLLRTSDHDEGGSSHRDAPPRASTDFLRWHYPDQVRGSAAGRTLSAVALPCRLFGCTHSLARP